MRILHVVPTYIPAWRYGGPIRSVHGLCKALVHRGHHVDVATTNVDGDGDTQVPLDAPVDIDGVNVHYFPSTRLRRLYYSPPMYRFLEQGMSGWDVVHTHSVFLWPTAAAAHLARRSGKPYVVSPRGMLVRELIDRRSSWIKRAWIRLVEKRNIAGAAAVHVTSPTEGRELLALGLEPKRVFEIPNGLDLSENHRHGGASLDLPSAYVLFLGRLSWKKGLDRLISAISLAPGAELVVAGNDDEGYWPKMAALGSKLGVNSRIRLMGFVEGPAKDELIARATMLALPSYSENFGNVVLEAMAWGVPVIVTPEVGLADVVRSTHSGLVVEGDPRTLGEAISRLASDSGLRAALGANGRTAAKAYSWDGIAQRMEEQYATLLTRHG